MSQGRRGKINYRCPHCLFRDIDFDLMFDKQANQFYCLRCNWEGNENEILLQYAEYKRKYKDMLKRYTVEDILTKDEEEVTLLNKSKTKKESVCLYQKI